MSDFNSRWREALQGKHGQSEDWQSLREEYPALADCLLGLPAKDGADGRPPMKILIFAEADKLKFMLSPLVGDLVAFGTFPDPNKGFDCLNGELQKGAFEWKKRRR